MHELCPGCPANSLREEPGFDSLCSVIDILAECLATKKWDRWKTNTATIIEMPDGSHDDFYTVDNQHAVSFWEMMVAIDCATNREAQVCPIMEG